MCKAVEVSVIIVSWNTRQLLYDCLQSVFTELGHLSGEVFVVDNASRDGSADMVASEFPSVALIRNESNVGFARANNQALQQSRGNYLVLLNPDTCLMPGALKKCLEFMDASADTGVVGGALLDPDGSFQAGYFDFPNVAYQLLCLRGRVGEHFLEWKADYSPHPPVREVDWVPGAFMVVRREPIEDVGLLDERFFMYSEETEWCLRIRKAGWKIHYLSYVEIVHHHRQSTKQAPAQLRAHAIRSQQIYFWTHRPKLEAATLMILSIGLGMVFTVRGLLGLLSDEESGHDSIQTGLTMIWYCLETMMLQQPRVPQLSGRRR